MATVKEALDQLAGAVGNHAKAVEGARAAALDQLAQPATVGAPHGPAQPEEKPASVQH